ncbi:terminase family protein [Fundidesulfovibrio butyratiphilus]
MSENPHFLPYQVRWLDDQSRIKIWEKSRRIGATYVQSYEDVRDCVRGVVPSVWFSSADESAAKEYIQYCEKWVKLFNSVAKGLETIEVVDERNIKVYAIDFTAGPRINALSSNPKAFRSKGGKVVLDEYAFHDDPDKMWAAARPCITWGFPLRILSTYNGRSGRYYRFVTDVKKNKLNWSLHSTPIQLAVAEGLADHILGRALSEAERAAWLEEERASAGDDDTWLQEYCCFPVDASAAFLTYEMIAKCERGDIVWDLADTQGDLFAGVDIGRKKDLTVIWVVERIADVKVTRLLLVLERTPFKAQRQALFSVLAHPRLRRACIDNTGLGMQLAEEAQDAFGKFKVEAVTFSGPVKEQLAYGLRTAMEDVALLVPAEHEVREDLHSVRRATTAAGNVRFDVAASEAKGHADRFWAAALAVHAAGAPAGPITVVSRGRRETSDWTDRY